jgi:RNA polymerase sigma factor (sigma-70 family)
MLDRIPEVGPQATSTWSALWKTAYQRYCRLWINLARSADISEDEAKDLVHNVIISILEEPTRPIQSLEHARNYVAKSVLNRVKGLRIRRGKRFGWADEMEKRFAVHQDEATGDERKKRDLLRSAVMNLPRRDFSILKLRFYSGFTLAQSSEILGMPISTIASREAVILRRIRLQLHKHGFSEKDE